MNSIKSFLPVLLLGCVTAMPKQSLADIVLLEGFEDGALPVVQESETDPSRKYLFNQYEGDPTEGPDPGSEEVTNTLSYAGNNSLKVNIDSGNIYLQFYPKINSLTWANMSEFVKQGVWENDKYNRLRFWMKLPPGVTLAAPGQTNMHFGTYVRASDGDPSSAESGGNHFYHYFNVESTGEWHQFIIDTHPTHARGNSGGTEEGDQEYPTGEPGYNYFDALTRFYIDVKNSLPNYPASYYLDGFELYEETNPENVDQVYSLQAVYDPDLNKLAVGWNRPKDENEVKHEIKYSFVDIFSIGWNAAISAPNSPVSPLGWQGYNRMRWTTTSIDVTGKSFIYIGIKPENSTQFRQIKIPVTNANIGAGKVPKPPSQLKVL